MTLVTLFFFAHQPVRLKPYQARLSDRIDSSEGLFDHFFDDAIDRDIFRRVASRCYYPATRALLDMVRRDQEAEKPFKVSFGLSGTFLLQAQRYEPDLITLFQELGATGCVEFTGETYYHSLSSLFEGDREEFKEQVRLHSDEIQHLFGQRPTVFRNTGCLYNNTIADLAMRLGFEGIITEGVDWLLEGWRSPDFVYRAACGLPVLLRNYRLSDDIRLRFVDRNWDHWPLTAEKLAGWLARNTDMNVLLALDYEAIGEHISADQGVFDLLRALPDAVRRYPQLEFVTPGEAIRRLPPEGMVLVNDFATISWAAPERDTSAWLSTEMQQFGFEELKRMEIAIRAADDPSILEAWRLMQTSDHLYQLSAKSLQGGAVNQYFPAYGALFESFVQLQTALSDLRQRAEQASGPHPAPPPVSGLNR